MATLIIKPNPFIKWKFKCKSASEVKQTKENVKNLLSYYLKGFANGLRSENPLYPKISFQIANETFSPVAGSRDSFIYSATVKRKSAVGAIFPNPDSTVNPQKPSKPKG
jgi:hypothetical protein